MKPVIVRALFLFMVAGFPAFTQSLPWYLISHYPEAGAVSVPTNTSILLSGLGSALNPIRGTLFSLRDQSGTEVPLSKTESFGPDYYVALSPVTPLTRSTRYTLSIRPSTAGGDPYSFSFTTGTGPDTVEPRLLAIDPKPGSTGVGLSGPITVRFDKVLNFTKLLGSNGVVINGQAYFYGGSASPTLDGKGIVIRTQGQTSRAYFDLSIDPAFFFDASGNRATGSVITAHYTTILVTDLQGPALKSYFPADGETELPTNVSVRLLFDRAPDRDSAVNSIRLELNGTPLKTKFDSFSDGRGVEVRPVDFLLPNQSYRVVVDSTLQDSDKLSIAQPLSFEFITGSGPDLVLPQVIEAEPSYPARPPLNAIFAIRTNKRIMPITTAVYESALANLPLPLIARISDNGRSFTVTPGNPLSPGTAYSLNLGDVVDVTGARFYQGASIQFITGFAEDHEAPQVLGISPPDGSTSVSPGAPIQIMFDEHIGASQTGDQVNLTSADGQRVAGKLSWDQMRRLLTYTPTSPLSGDTRYRIDLANIVDLAGNTTPPLSAGFTTGATSSRILPKLVSSTLSDGDEDVDPTRSFDVTYDQPLNPATSADGAIIWNAALLPYPVRTSVSGGTLTVTPIDPLPANSRLKFQLQTFDVSGTGIYLTINFTTGRNPDTSSPEVTSVAPADGAVLDGSQQFVILKFSKPVDPASVNFQNILVYGNGAEIQRTVTISADNRSALITFSQNAAGDISVFASGSVQDTAANPLVPFRANYHLSAKIPAGGGGADVVEMRPPTGSLAVSPRTPITWIVRTPLDKTVVDANLVVLADGAIVAGTFSLSSGARVLRFVPNSPFPAGAVVSMLQRRPVIASFFAFTIENAPVPGPLRIVRSNVDSIIEVEFNQEPPLGQSLLTLLKNNLAVPTIETKPRPRTIRLTPVTPLDPSTYYAIKLAPQLVSDFGQFLNLNTRPAATPAPAAILAAGPPNGATDVPLNASIRFTLGEPLNLLTVSADSIQIRSGDRALPGLRKVIQDYSGRISLVFTTAETLPENSRIEVSVSGLEDRLGRPIPIRNWSFQTGTTIDTEPPLAIAQTVRYGVPNEISSDTPLQVVFNEPIDPASQEVIGDARVVFSDDLRTATIIPARPFAQGRDYSLSLNGIRDLSGNTAGAITTLSFTVAFGRDSSVPHLLAAFPSDNQKDLPLNTEVLVTFDKTVPGTALGGIRLLKDSEPIPLTSRSDYDSHRVRLAPVRLLDANTTYRLEVAGIKDSVGNIMAETVTRTFTTGSRVDTVAPAGQFLWSSSLPRNVLPRMRFSKPLNPATIDSNSVVLYICDAKSCQVGSVAVPSVTTLSQDGLLATITPRDPFIPGRLYLVGIRGLSDYSGNQVTFSNSVPPTFIAQGGEDSTPPLVTIMPADGLTDLPTNVQIVALVSEAVELSPGTTLLRLFKDDRPVSGTVTQSSQAFSFRPLTPLTPGATYRIEVAALTDLSGNTAPPVSSSFTIRQSPAPDTSPLRLVSSSPANGDAGIPTDSRVTLVFDKPVNPASIVSGVTIQVTSSSGFPVAGTFSTLGKTVVFAPSLPLPGAAGITFTLETTSRFGSVSLQDLAGNRLDRQYFFNFKTLPNADSSAPQLLSISPQPGTPLAPPEIPFVMTFSKPVVIPLDSLRIFGGSQPISSFFYQYGADLRIVTFTTQIPPETKLTIVGTSDIKDDAGNSLDPFTFEYPTLKAEPSGGPQIISITPSFAAREVTSLTPIRVQFNKTMNAGSVLEATRVTQDGEIISGKLEMFDSNRGVQFTPDAPYAAGSRIDIFILQTASDFNGLRLNQKYNSYFMTAGTPTSAALAVNQTSLFGAALEIEFNRDLDPLTISNATVWLRSGRTAVPGIVSLLDDRTVSFEPSEPLTPGIAYALTAGLGIRASDGTGYQGSEHPFRAEPTSGPAEIKSVEVVRAFGRDAIRVRFTAPVKARALKRARSLRPLKSYVSTDRSEWLLVPENSADLNSIKAELSKW